MHNAPLTAAEIEEIKALVGNHYTTWESDDKEAAATYLARLLSLLTPPPDAADIKEIETLLNHETVPHCCGCWVIQYGNNDVGLRARCNECGQTVDLLSLLTPPPDAAVREAVES